MTACAGCGDVDARLQPHLCVAGLGCRYGPRVRRRTALLTFSLLGAGVATPVVAGVLGFLPAAAREVRQLDRRTVAPVLFAETSAFSYQVLTFAAVSAGPAVYVFAIEGVQPLLLLVLGLAIAWLAPRFSTEVFTGRILWARIASSAVIVAGVLALAANDAS